MPTALVTGGCGFVGRHLTKRLLSENYDVWLIDNLSTGKPPPHWLPTPNTASIKDRRRTVYRHGAATTTFIKADCLTFFTELSQSARAVPVFDKIFHLAAVVGGRTLIENDPLAVAADLAIDATFFRWLATARDRVGHVVYASSSAAYPIALQTSHRAPALKETDISFTDSLGLPDMTYGWSKLTGEYLSLLAAQRYGISMACVRPFSGYGGDQDISYPIPAIARRAAKRDDPLVIWGSGRQARDFVHINDCIEAIIRAANTITDGSAINIATGQATTFRQVAALFAQLAGYQPRIKNLSHKPAGVQHRVGNPAHLKKILGWQPTISLREGFAQVLAQQQQQLTQTARHRYNARQLTASPQQPQTPAIATTRATRR